MRRFIAIVIPFLAILVTVFPAGAAITWCKSDPTVSLNGTLVDITIAIPLEYVPRVNGPVRFEIQTPPEVARQVILTDVGYNGHGVEVTFTDLEGEVKDGWFPVNIEVVVPIDHPPSEVIPAELTVSILNGEQAGRVEMVPGTSDFTSMQLTIKGTPPPDL